MRRPHRSPPAQPHALQKGEGGGGRYRVKPMAASSVATRGVGGGGGGPDTKSAPGLLHALQQGGEAATESSTGLCHALQERESELLPRKQAICNYALVWAKCTFGLK